MSELISIPTVEQINLEHQLANSKASEAVQHATNCGLMLLQIKASKQHGEWLPWLKAQQESGAIGFSQPTASKYMKLAANYNRGFNFPETTSIRAALELLSDREPAEQQGELIDVEAERQARKEAEARAEAERQGRLTAEQRNAEWAAQNKADRDKLRQAEINIAGMERRIDHYASQAATQAGLSERQKVTALRVASVPQPVFEQAVESDEPPTVTQLAELGKQPKPAPVDVTVLA